eukprot:11202089-Alexandrium_andersonii.AAC.1
MAKLTLQHSQMLRDVNAAVFKVVLIPSDSAVVKTVMKAGKAYHEEVQKRGKEHALGPPSTHMWLAAVRAVAEAKE